jgi:hypothetical protein
MGDGIDVVSQKLVNGLTGIVIHNRCSFPIIPTAPILPRFPYPRGVTITLIGVSAADGI